MAPICLFLTDLSPDADCGAELLEHRSRRFPATGTGTFRLTSDRREYLSGLANPPGKPLPKTAISTYVILYQENDMASAARQYTPAEAAALSGVAVKTVHNAIDKRIVEAQARSSAKRVRRSLSAQDVLRLKLWHEVGAILSPERRQRLFAEIEEHPTAKRVKADAFVIVDVEEARKQIAKRVRDLDAAEAAVTQSSKVMGGEPVFKGTRIPVRLVASMLDQGVSEAEILDGYPGLEARHLEFARIWGVAHPRRGRPKTLADRGVTVRSRSRATLKPDPGPTMVSRPHAL